MKEDFVCLSDSENSSEKILIFYHKDDNDGVVSAALLLNYMKDVFKDKIDGICLIGLDYNDVSKYDNEVFDLLRKEYSKIFITDISFSVDLMAYIWRLWGKNMHWFDHHLPKIKEVAQSGFVNHIHEIPGERCTDRSAILCVWKFINDPFDIDHDKIPELLRVLSGWDSFTYEKEGFSLDYVKTINDGFTDICELDVLKASQILEDDLEKYREQSLDVGKSLTNHEKLLFRSLVEKIGDCSWKVVENNGKEHSACCIVYGGKTNSLMFDCVKDEVECGIVLKKNKDQLAQR